MGRVGPQQPRNPDAVGLEDLLRLADGAHLPGTHLAEERAILRCERTFGFHLQLDGALEYLPLTCNNSEFSHVKKKTVFYHSRNGINLSGDRVGIFYNLTEAIENKISFICNVGFTISSGSNRWREAKITKCVAYKWRGHLDHFNR